MVTGIGILLRLMKDPLIKTIEYTKEHWTNTMESSSKEYQYICKECGYKRPGLLDKPAIGIGSYSTICPECKGSYYSIEAHDDIKKEASLVYRKEAHITFLIEASTTFQKEAQPTLYSNRGLTL